MIQSSVWGLLGTVQVYVLPGPTVGARGLFRVQTRAGRNEYAKKFPVKKNRYAHDSMPRTPNDPYFGRFNPQKLKVNTKKGSVWVLGIDMLNQNHVWSMFRASLRFMSWSYWFQAKEGIATRNARHIGTAPRLGGGSRHDCVVESIYGSKPPVRTIKK